MSEEQEIQNNSGISLDFITSNSVNYIDLKFLLLYVPILYCSGFLVVIYWYIFVPDLDYWVSSLILLPFSILFMILIFLIGTVFFTKLFLIILNLIHKPKQGVFAIDKHNRDFEFWRLRTALKKLPVWFLNNCPLPYIDVLGFRWFGVRIDFSSHLNDAWVDIEFIKFGRKVMVGQAAVVMSSMLVGKYLIIKEVILDDYTVVGGQSTVSPGTIIGKDSVVGALSGTTYKQVLESGWIYFGLPARVLKQNKYAESKPTSIKRIDVDEAIKYDVEHDINIDEENIDLINEKERSS